jgi:hydrogenase-4 component F
MLSACCWRWRSTRWRDGGHRRRHRDQGLPTRAARRHAATILGSLSLIAQRQYKRLLAYSSIEHTGLACFGLALGPLGSLAALVHLTGHALAKSTAFLVAGRVLHRYRRSDTASTSGVLTAMPASGVQFGTSLLALMGLPPFSLFLSEILLLRAGWVAGHPVLTVGVMVLLVSFCGVRPSRPGHAPVA